MPRYSPLPKVSIDPRNESQIVQAASQVAYEASNKTLNDFSSGNPLSVLLEGQAFAQGEFLYWANQLPDKILVEWIGPFLGAMRKLGTPAAALLSVTINPKNTSTVIPAGTTFTTNPQITSGQSYLFLSSTDLVIPAGERSGSVSVYSQYVGSQYNCPSNSITGSSFSGNAIVSVTNPLPATGGSDVETFQQVQERFFSLIRRANPVSSSDWENFFIDVFGEGTMTTVQPNRSSQLGYNYQRDYSEANGQVALFILGPDGVELSEDMIKRAQNLVNLSVPVENQATVFPITLSEVQYNIDLEIDSNGSFGQDFKATSLNFRNRLFSVLTPGEVFPADVDPSVGDVDAAFYNTFDSSTRFKDPRVVSSGAYNTPNQLSKESATYTNVHQFETTDNLFSVNDLVQVNSANPTFFPVNQSFTPYSSQKKDQTVYGNLSLKQIKELVPGRFDLGDIVYYSGNPDGSEVGLHVVLENISLGSSLDIPTAIVTGKISSVKTYSPWLVGNTYQYSTMSGVIDPQIVEYDYSPDEFFPSQPSTVALNSRPGALAWLVSQNFILNPSTNDLAGAQAQSKIGSAITPQILLPGGSYSAGAWVYTPQVGSGPDEEIDPMYYYVDITKGAVTKYAKVVSSFTYNPNNSTISSYFDSLSSQGIIEPIQVIRMGQDGQLPIFKYRPRFPVLQYLEYKQDSASEPSFYVSARYFTPSSTSILDLLDKGDVFELASTPEAKLELASYLSSDSSIKPVRMFTFYRGDRTFFRNGSDVRSFTATSNVTPLFDFGIYLNNGVFVESERIGDLAPLAQGYIPYFNPTYAEYAEDTIVSEDGKNLFRVMRAFTPQTTVSDWVSSSSLNSCRFEEYQGNLLRYVSFYSCDQEIQSQYGLETSAIRLGIASISLTVRNTSRYGSSQQKYVYVWEDTNSLGEVPKLSWYTGTISQYSPPDYRSGTLQL